MIVAISTHPETEKVERLTHEFPVLLVDLEGMEVRGTRVIESEVGAKEARAQSLKDADILICTDLGQSEEDVLREFGVGIAYVDEGVDASAALASLAHQLFGGGCCGGHHHASAEHDEHAHAHEHSHAGGCCGGGGHHHAGSEAQSGGCCGGGGHAHEGESEGGGCCGGGGHAHEGESEGGGCCGGHGKKSDTTENAGSGHGCGCRHN